MCENMYSDILVWFISVDIFEVEKCQPPPRKPLHHGLFRMSYVQKLRGGTLQAE